jgi:long-chain acyl-CoA synthetase
MAAHQEAEAPPPPLGGGGNLAAVLTRAAERWPQRCALVHAGTPVTYAELERRSGQAAALLRELGVQAGDRVGLQVPNSPAFVALYHGILRVGAVVVPQNPRATQREVEQAVGDAGARLLLTRPPAGGPDPAAAAAGPGPLRVVLEDDDAHALLHGRVPDRDVHPADPQATAVILYTSGTTGRPKGAELTHANLRRNADAAVDIYGLTGADVVLGALPLYHSYGQTCTLNGAFAVGARVVLMPRFDAEGAAALVAQERVTVLLGVPTMFADLAHAAAPASAYASLRMCSSGGAPLPEEVRAAFSARTGAVLHETYGLSETSPIASFNGLRGAPRTGTVGWPIPGTEMKVADPGGSPAAPGEVGEIALRGHNIMKGYWANPQATHDAIDADGWFFSGDLGVQEPDGSFRVVGRVKDMIIRGGLNVYPREIEELLHAHPAVRAAAVVGIPDARLGEEVGAAIVLDAGAEVTPDELRAWVRERVMPYKAPRHVWMVDALPTGPTGKVLKREIAPPAGVGEGGA